MTKGYILMKFEANLIKATPKIRFSSSHEIDQKLTLTFDLDLDDLVWLLIESKYVYKSIIVKYGWEMKK